MKVRDRVRAVGGRIDGALGVIAEISEVAARLGHPYALVHLDDHTAELLPLHRLRPSTAPEVRPFETETIGEQERKREKARRRADLVRLETPLADIAPRTAASAAPGSEGTGAGPAITRRGATDQQVRPVVVPMGPSHQTPAEVSAAGTGLGARAGRAEANMAGAEDRLATGLDTSAGGATGRGAGSPTVAPRPHLGAPDVPPRDAPPRPAVDAAPPAEADTPAAVHRGGAKRWTRDRIILLFREHHEIHGHAPTWSEWRHAEPGRPSSGTVRDVFGSWGAAINAAGIPAKIQAPRPLEWPPDAVITAIQTWAEEHGAPPRIDDWRNAGYGHPTWMVVKKRFGSWGAGIAAAGFTPRPVGRPRKVAA